MSRYTPTTVSSGFNSVDKINENFANIAVAVADTLSRVGDSPNHLQTDIDCNSYRLYNLPNATSNTEPVTYQQWLSGSTASAVSGYFKFTATATASQTVVSSITPAYVMGLNMIDVFVNGVCQHPSAYSETTSSSITFTSGLDAGDEVLVVVKSATPASELFAAVRTERQTATASQSIFNLTTTSYSVGSNNLAVYVNGLRMVGGGIDYSETNSTRVTFVSGLALNDEVVFVIGEVVGGEDLPDAEDVDYQYSSTATVRTVGSRLQERASVKDFGAVGNGVTDDTTAVQLAINSATQVYFPPGTYLVGKITVSSDVDIFGAGKAASIIKLKASTNDHVFYISGDRKVSFRDLKIDGNYTQNPTLAPNYPCGILCPYGSVTVEKCHITGVKSHAIHTGNTDYEYGASLYAHDCIIKDNLIEQLTITENLGDCIRIHRTKRFVCSDNICIGGLSGIRSNYYCEKGIISNNVVKDSHGDVGVTSALSTDMTVDGNVCTGHFQHGIEVDSVYRGVVSNNVCSGNSKYGIFLSEYGPPSGTSYSGTIDGVSVSYPTVLTNKDLTVSGNACAKNNFSGIACIGLEKTTLIGNVLSENNTGNNGASYACGVYVDGGTLNKDDVTITGNTFESRNYQTQSVYQANAQFSTKTGGNKHTVGTKHFSYGVRGGLFNNISDDPYVQGTANLSGTAMTLVEDTSSITNWARQIDDASGAGTTTSGVKILNVPRYGEKLVVFRFRNVNTMTSCDIFINLYLAGAFVYTAYSSSRTGLGTGWVDVVVRLPDSLKSYNYDNIDVGITTNSALTGKINVEEVSCFMATEK